MHASATAGTAWTRWQQALRALDPATAQASDREREHERLTWQISEVDKLNPGADEWPELNEEHKRLSHAQALIDAAKPPSRHGEADDNAAGPGGTRDERDRSRWWTWTPRLQSGAGRAAQRASAT